MGQHTDEKLLSNDKVYRNVARALARGYTDLYYLNLETEDFVEFHTDDESGVLTEARRGTGFFTACQKEAQLGVHPNDRADFLKAMNRGVIEAALKKGPVMELIYRRIKNGVPFYVQMKISRAEEDERFVIMAVSDIDEQMRQRREEERIQEERVVYARLHAITGNFIVVYVVDPGTGIYREFSATDLYESSFNQEKEGTDFFNKVREVARVYNYPADLKRFLTLFTQENVMAEIEKNGIFTLGYRVLVDGEPKYVQLKAAMVEEREGQRLVVGMNDVDVQVRQQQEQNQQLAEAQSQANVDALTGVRNKHAFLRAEAKLDGQIADGEAEPFAVAVLDLNDLKKINDTAGHQAGDQYIKDACKLVCDTFKRSPVFRVGGDEFAVISQGSDYECIDELVNAIANHNAEASKTGGLVVACGMSKFENDDCVAAVYERADQNMYENKSKLKSGKPA